MNKKARVSIIAIMILLVVAIVVAASFVVSKNPTLNNDVANESFDRYNFEREIEVDGNVFEFYQSGDQQFKYDHDKYGNVLVPNEDRTNLEYLTKVDGEIVGSGVTLDQDASGIEKVSVSDLDRNDPRFKLEPIEIKGQNRMAYSSSQMSIKNLVVYVKFKGETTSNPFPPENMINFTDLDNYYKTLTQNKISVDSIPAKEANDTYIYEAPYDRSYYDVKDSSSSERRNKEYELVKSILTSISTKYNVTADDIDKLGPNGVSDGYVDSVSIFITGSRNPTWGGLLWPHKWNIREIKGADPSDPKMLGKWFGDYTFNFIDSVDIGTVCHEMGHVLGAPDYYHYNNDFVPTGEWDLMSFNKKTPQYMLVHTRNKYLKSIKPEQIQTITSSGTYTAYATTLSRVSGEGVGKPFAYKIPTDKSNEYIMVEMRTKSSVYDWPLPGSGLIVYRVKEGINGNADAVYRKVDKPDEVYVYRPAVSLKPTTSPSQRYSASYSDAKLGYLSVYNNHFNNLGKPLDPNNKKTYESDAIYYVDGTNTGIQITPLSTSTNYSQFRIVLPGDENLPENIFDKFEILNAELFQDDVGAGVKFFFSASSGLNLSLLKNIQASLVKEGQPPFSIANIDIAKFKSEYNSYKSVFEGRFYLGQTVDLNNLFHHTRVMTGNAVSEDEYPQEVSLVIFDINNNFSIEKKIAINKAGKSWSTLSKLYPEATIYASNTMSVALDKNGIARTNIPLGHTGDVPYNTLEAKWNIEGRGPYISIALGRDHVLALTKNLDVEAYGYDYRGEIGARNWSNILNIAAGTGTSYGVTVDGTVLALGADDLGQMEVDSWTNIVDIVAHGNNVIGITENAKAKVAGVLADEVKQAIEAETNVSKVGLSKEYAVLIYKDGTVKAFGNDTVTMNALNEVLASLTGIKKVSVADSYFSLLTNAGKVITPMGPSQAFMDQFNSLIDIVDLSCSNHHAMFLREDGFVEYIGQNDVYQTNVEFNNLIYTGVGEFKEVTNIEIRDSFGFSMATTMQLDYDAGNPQHVYLTMKTVAQGGGLSTYKRLMFSTSPIEGKDEVAEIQIDIEAHPNTGNDILPEGQDITKWKITSIKEGFIRLNITAHGTDISKTIDIEVRQYIPLDSILIEGTKLDENGDPDLTKASIFIEEYASYASVPPPLVQLKILKNPSNALGLTPLPKPTYTASPSNLVTINDSGQIRAVKGASGECIVTATLSIKNTTYSTQTVVKIVSEIESISAVYPSGITSFDLKYGDSLPYAEMKIKIIRNVDGGTVESEMGVSATMVVSGTYNPVDLSAEQQVRITYLGKECIFKVSVNDYVSSIFITNPQTRYKLGTTFIDANTEIGEIKYTKASSGDEITCAYLDKPFNGKFFTNLAQTSLYTSPGERTIELVYSKQIGSYLNQVRTIYQIQVVDYVKSISFLGNPPATLATLEYQSDLKDFPYYLKLTFQSTKEISVDLSRVTISGFDANVVGAHEVKFSYKDEFGNEVETSKKIVDVILQGSRTEIFGYESHVGQGDHYFYYLQNGDLILDDVKVTLPSSDKSLIVEKYNPELEQDIYYNFETNDTGEVVDKFNKAIIGKPLFVPIYIYAKEKEGASIVFKQQLTHYVTTFGILRWEIKGMKEEGEYISPGTEENPLEFAYADYERAPNQSEIALYFNSLNPYEESATLSPKNISFDENVVDQKQPLNIQFIGNSKPQVRDGVDFVDQTYWIIVRDVIEDILIDDEIVINYSNDGASLENTLASKVKLSKRFAGEVSLLPSDYSSVTYVDPSGYLDITKELTDNGVVEPVASHELTVKYLTFEKNFRLRVKDEVVNMAVASNQHIIGYQDNYMDYLNNMVFEFTLRYSKDLNGNPEKVEYTLNALITGGVVIKEDENFNNEAIDTTQTVTITHTRSNKYIEFHLTVKDYVSSLSLTFLNTDKIFTFNSKPAIFYKDILEESAESFVKIRRFMKSGEENDILATRYYLEGVRSHRYDDTGALAALPGSEQNSFSTSEPVASSYLVPGNWKIKAIYVPAAGEYVRSTADITSTVVDLLVQNYVTEMSVKLKDSATNPTYRFGSTPDFSEIILTATMVYSDTGTNKVNLSGKTDITRSFEIIYDSTKGGSTRIDIRPKAAFKKTSVSAGYNVTFAAKKDLVFIKNDMFSKSPRDLKILKFEILVFNGPTEFNKIFNKIANLNTDFNFLIDHIYLNNVKISLDSNVSVKSGDMLEFRNGDGNTVFKYMLAVIGDANQDGKVNSDDIVYLATMLLMKRYDENKYIPEIMGGNKASSDPLTSFISRVRAINNPEPLNAPLPINDVANIFISKKTNLKAEKEETIITVS
ncbi:MAG: M6 family metalloprotease domain-containing protein [Christensenellales bacterium]|jgi:M6 family metalloprotease-like protein|nr:M6 family metalloprotease domain-containing protein [Clostridiales bacterium]